MQASQKRANRGDHIGPGHGRETAHRGVCILCSVPVDDDSTVLPVTGAASVLPVMQPYRNRHNIQCDEDRDDPNGESDSFVETLQEDRSQKTDEHQRDYYSMSQKRQVLFDERILYNMCGRVGGGECDRDDEAGRNKSQECKNEHFPFPT